MSSDQEGLPLDHAHLADLERVIDGIARAMERLAALGAASTEEADAFANCIEALWIKVIGMRRTLVRGVAKADQHAEDQSEIARTIRMLESDLSFARERFSP